MPRRCESEETVILLAISYNKNEIPALAGRNPWKPTPPRDTIGQTTPEYRHTPLPRYIRGRGGLGGAGYARPRRLKDRGWLNIGLSSLRVSSFFQKFTSISKLGGGYER